MYLNVEKEYVRCKQCNEVNEFCGLSDFSYGKLLVRLFRGTKYLYVDMMTDPVFKEIESMIPPEISKKNPRIVQLIYGITCDPVDGRTVEMVSDRRCIKCRANDYEPTIARPCEHGEISVECPTHKMWDKFSVEEKNIRIADKLQKIV